MDSFGDRLAIRISTLLRLVIAVVVGLVVVPPAMVAVGAATLIYAPLPAGELPEERERISAIPSVVYDANGREIAVFRGFDRTVDVLPSEVPEIVHQAVVAIEDQRFWEHAGVDVEGVGRAARTNLELGQVAQGGSTITQQYVKNAYLSREQTLERKVEEALLAIELEKRMTKEEILFGYLTTSYFGEGAYGIGAAAQVYFGKKVADLDISEAATLAGMVQAPTRLSPRNDLEATERRRRLVLQSMADQEYIDQADLERETARPLWFAESGDRPDGAVTVLVPRPPKGATDQPFFVDWVERELVDRFGPDLVYQGGLIIETTIDPEIQAMAEQAVADRLKNTEFPVEMSLVSIDPSTGHVVAMVGGRDYDFSQVNLATGGSTGFQPGSSFKPIVLAAAFNMGTGPETTYPAPGQWKVPDCYGDGCTISNYDYSSRGNISLRQAMTASVNTVFAQLVLDVSIDDTVELARNLGLERIDPDRQYGASLSLGAAESSPLEMASAYGTFANRGIRQEPTGVIRVVDAEGNVLLDNRKPAGVAVLDPIVADNVTDVLVGVVENGTGKRAQLDRPVAGKTGTAQNYTAAWFVGYTPELATAVWMGHADRLESLRRVNGVGAVTGGSHPAVAWRDFMSRALAGTEPTAFPAPEQIVPLAETAEEVVYIRPKEETVIRNSRNPAELAPNCGGGSCERYGVPAVPHVPRPERPTTTTIYVPETTTEPQAADPAAVPPTPTTTLPTE